MQFDLFSSLTIGCLLAIVVVLVLTCQSRSAALQEAQATIMAREKTIRSQGTRFARLEESGAQQSLDFNMQLGAIEDKHVQKLRLAGKEYNENLLTAEKNFSESLDALKADHDQQLNTRMSGLAQKKARDMAAKQQALASKDGTIASQSAELTRLENELRAERAHGEELRTVTIKLQAELSDSAAKLALLQAEHTQAVTNARGRRDSVMAAGSSNLVSKHHDVIAALREQESLLRQAHARELARARQQSEVRLKIRELELMRACVRDLERAADVGSTRDSVVWERRVCEWKGQVRQLEREVGEEITQG